MQCNAKAKAASYSWMNQSRPQCHHSRPITIFYHLLQTSIPSQEFISNLIDDKTWNWQRTNVRHVTDTSNDCEETITTFIFPTYCQPHHASWNHFHRTDFYLMLRYFCLVSKCHFTPGSWLSKLWAALTKSGPCVVPQNNSVIDDNFR